MRFIALVCVFAALVGSATAQQSARHALVIGNDSYQHVEKLINSRSDARSIATALEQSGFRVTLRTDLDLNGFKTALRTFKAQITGGDEAVFFFAGHGLELDGANYLLPVDILGDSSDQVKDDGLPLQRVLDDLRERRARFSLAIIDACRNNPFQGAGRSIGGRGLAPTTAVSGQMVLYSAGSGQVALDQLGPSDPVRNGLFTRVLLKEMIKPGAEVREVLRDVREEVASLAKSVGREQVPAVYDQTIGRFYFRNPSGTSVGQSSKAPDSKTDFLDIENRFWESAQKIGNREAYEAYLQKYPSGQYSTLALAAIRNLSIRPGMNESQRSSATVPSQTGTGSPASTNASPSTAGKSWFEK